MNRLKRVICLYRVSTVGQVDHDDIPMQRIACREYAASHPDWKIIKEISEKGVSVYDTGSIIKLDEISFVSEQSCKILGFICFLLSFTIFSLTGIKSRNRLKPMAVASSVFSQYE